MLRTVDLEAGYGKLRVLKHVSMHVGVGEIVTIIGANGAGKTTLLHTIAGLLRARGGSIHFGPDEITRTQAERRVAMGASLVPEGRQVFSAMSVHENLLLGAHVRFARGQGAEVPGAMEHVFTLFPRLRERQAQLAGTLSGGEQQMLAMGRALMAGPRLIMMDEPSMGLAPLVVKEIFNIVRRLRYEGNTVLLVEQNATAALAIADRGYVLETGRIVLQGPAAELLQNRDVQRAYLGRDLDAETEI